MVGGWTEEVTGCHNKKSKRNTMSAAVKKPKISASDRATMTLFLNHISALLEEQKANNNGIMPYGAIANIVKEKKALLPWLTTTRVHNHLKAIKTKQKKAILDVANATLPTDGVPLIAARANGTIDDDDDDDDIGKKSAPVQIVGSSTLESSSESDSSENESDDEAHTQTEATAPGTAAAAATVGRPKGTTNEDLSKRIKTTILEAAKEYQVVKARARDNNKRSPKGALALILQSAKERNDIPSNVTISMATILTKVKRLEAGGKDTDGRASPMLKAEPYLVYFIVEMYNIGEPLTADRGLELANSLIDGTPTFRELQQWKLLHGHRQFKNDQLTQSYWRGFIRRNSHVVSAKIMGSQVVYYQ